MDTEKILENAKKEAERTLEKVNKVEEYRDILPYVHYLGTRQGPNIILNARLVSKIQDLLELEVEILLKELRQGEARCL